MQQRSKALECSWTLLRFGVARERRLHNARPLVADGFHYNYHDDSGIERKPLRWSEASPKGRLISSHAAGSSFTEPGPDHLVNGIIREMKSYMKYKEAKKVVDVFNKNLEVLRKAGKDKPFLVADAYDFALQAYAADKDAGNAESLVHRMWKDGIPVGRVANSSVVKALCSVHKRSDALRYLKSVSAQRSDIVGYNILLSSCAESKDYVTGILCWNTLQQKIKKCRNSRFKQSPISWGAILRLQGQAKDAENLLSIWEEWLAECESNINISEADKTSVAASYVGGLCEVGDFEQAIQTCEDLLETISIHLPVQLDVADVTEDSSKLQYSVERERHKKHSSSVQNVRVACNTVLHAAVGVSRYSVMDSVVRTMVSRGLTPDNATYNALLRRSSRRREGSGAIKEGILEMERLGLSPDRISIEILIQSLAIEGAIDEAENAVFLMIELYETPPGSAWSVLLEACGSHGDIHGLDQAFGKAEEHMLARGCRSQVIVSCLRALYNVSNRDYWQDILRFPRSNKLEEENEDGHISTPKEIGKALLTKLDAALHEMELENHHDFKFLLLQNMIAFGRVEDAQAIIVQECGILPVICPDEGSGYSKIYAQIMETPMPSRRDIALLKETYAFPSEPYQCSGILQAFGRKGNVSMCLAMIRRIKELGMNLQLEDCVSLIECCAASSPLQDDMAYTIFHDFKQGHSKDDVRVWNALLLVEAQRPHEPLQAVAQYIDKMKLGIVKPNVFSYFVLREVAMLHHDKGISESARVSITEHMRAFRHGDILSAAQTEQAKQSSEYVQQEDGNTLIESLAHVPDELLPPDDHSIHWKGYYASDEDDTW
eukprot:jgi/Picsp_1/2210/NSC_05674-R1_pentatricopeptide repeat-containing protein